MTTNITCEPMPDVKDYYNLKIVEQGGKKIEIPLEKSEVRQVIGVLDNAI